MGGKRWHKIHLNGRRWSFGTPRQDNIPQSPSKFGPWPLERFPNCADFLRPSLSCAWYLAKLTLQERKEITTRQMIVWLRFRAFNKNYSSNWIDSWILLGKKGTKIVKHYTSVFQLVFCFPFSKISKEDLKLSSRGRFINQKVHLPPTTPSQKQCDSMQSFCN